MLKLRTWYSTGEDTFTIEPAEKTERGTEITVKLKEDAEEFAQESRLREIIKKHSDFIPYPIYMGEEKQLVNQRTALWRQSPREVEVEKYDEFYRQFTLDFEPPLTHMLTWWSMHRCSSTRCCLFPLRGKELCSRCAKKMG